MQENIIGLFSHNHELRFSDIEKLSRIRSNKLSYHLKQLVNKGILEKNNNFYRLHTSYEHIIPYITDKKSVLPVILVAIKDRNNVFLIKRNKRPFKGMLSLPGGRLILGETIKTACERVGKKFGVNCKLQKINSVSLEFVKKGKDILHSFILIFVTATTKDKIEYFNPEKSKKSIISSDYHLLKNHLSRETEIPVLFSKTS